jgi:hypothetical protein
MASAIGNRRGKKTRHTTVTEEAAKIYSLLLRSGFVACPGAISGSPGSQRRITITYELNRTRITIASKGVQDLHIYGVVNREKLEAALRGYPNSLFMIRDHTK